MRFSKKTNSLILLILALLNIIMRLPISNHEYSTTDSFFIHTLATSISNYGYAKWIIHPFSLIGVYPLSYCSMYPYLLSGTSTLTNVTIEDTVLMSSIILSLFGMLSIYLVAKEVKDNDLFALLVAVVFSTSPVFLTYTNWTATARSPFVALLPFFIYLLLKSHRNFKWLTFAIVFLLFLMTVHQLFYLIPIILISYTIAVLVSIFRIDVDKISRIGHQINSTAEIYHSHKILLLAIIILISFYIQKGAIIENFADGWKTSSDVEISFIRSTFNILINYTGKIGLNLFFGFLGLVSIVKNEKLSFNNKFILISSIFLIFAIRYRYYTPLFYLPFISIFIGYGIELLLFKGNSYKKIRFVFLILLIVSSTSFSMYMNSHWHKIPTNNAMKDETYNTALFVKEKTNGTFISNEGNMGQQINAVSGVSVLPFGVVLWYSPGQLIYDFEDKNNLQPNLLPLKDLLPPPDVWYSFSGISNVKEDYQNIMYYDIDSDIAQERLLQYNIKNCVLYKPLENGFISYGVRNSKFIPSMIEKEDKIFDSNTESIWYFE